MGAAPAFARLNAAPESCAQDYAQGLLADLGDSFGALKAAPVQVEEEHPAVTWAQSGLMSLTGFADGDPLMCPAPLAACADGALAALEALASADFRGQRGSQLLAVRAAIAGYSRQGESSPGGSCRLLPAADGILAVNLARDSDWELVPAWLEAEVAPAWNAVAAVIRTTPARQLEERARLLGLAVARSQLPASSTGWFSVAARGGQARPDKRAPRVVDLSALWAGPLCAELLHRCGAEVIKVESSQRPDGARNGPRAFFDLLNAGKASVALDFATEHDRSRLRELITGADIVIESSRPRALRQVGIHAEELIAKRPGLTWISLSGYGRDEPQNNWIAYGDDAGVAAGLSELMRLATGRACMVGDAIADPLTGIHAALVAWADWQSGGGALLSLSLRDVVRNCMNVDLPAGGELRRRQAEWTGRAGPVLRPTVHARARLPGAVARGPAPVPERVTADG